MLGSRERYTVGQDCLVSTAPTQLHLRSHQTASVTMRRPIDSAAWRNPSSENMSARERRLAIRHVDSHSVLGEACLNLIESGAWIRQTARVRPHDPIGEQSAAPGAKALGGADVLRQADA